MEMFIPIVLGVAAMVAVIRFIAKAGGADDVGAHEGPQTHNDAEEAPYRADEEPNGMMSPMEDEVASWGIESENDFLNTSAVGGGEMWRDVENEYRHVVNPASGLPMTSGSESGVDVMGNPYGTDFHREHTDYSGDSGSGGIDSWNIGSSGQDGSFRGCDDWS